MASGMRHRKKRSTNIQKKKSEIRKRPIHNYNFLRKYLLYARTLEPVLTSEAEDMLNCFWKKAKIEGTMTNRSYDSIFRIAEAQAKLSLKTEIDYEVARESMESFQLMMVQYGKTIDLVDSPRNVTYRAFLNILKNTHFPISIRELCRIACEENKQISEYLGDKWSVEQNRKLKSVKNILVG